MIGYIYLTTCKINDKKYVGRKTSQIFLGNSYLGSGVHIKNAIAKYGKENFNVELLERCETADDLVIKEMYWIKYYDAVNSTDFYNHSYGGYNEGFLPGEQNIAKTEYAKNINSLKHKGKKMSDEFGKHQSELHKGKPSGMKGHHHSEETKKKLSLATHNYLIHRPHEKIQQISESAKGNKMMNKDGKCIRAHEDKFDYYLSNGWKFGGLKRNIDRSGSKNPAYGKAYVKGRIWICKGNQRLYITPDLLDGYLKDGWIKGMKDKRNI